MSCIASTTNRVTLRSSVAAALCHKPSSEVQVAMVASTQQGCELELRAATQHHRSLHECTQRHCSAQHGHEPCHGRASHRSPPTPTAIAPHLRDRPRTPPAALSARSDQQLANIMTLATARHHTVAPRSPHLVSLRSSVAAALCHKPSSEVQVATVASTQQGCELALRAATQHHRSFHECAQRHCC